LLNVVLVIAVISIVLTLLSSFNSLKDRSQIVSFVSEAAIYKRANVEFKERFEFLAGDFPFADRYFEGTENGNGDGNLDSKEETLFAWDHLEKAEVYFLKFDFKARPFASVDENMVRSDYFKDCGVQILTDSKLNRNHVYFGGDYLFVRYAKGKGSGNLTHSCLSGLNAEQIDKKLDDGFPLKGKFFSEAGYDKEVGDCVCDEIYCVAMKLVCYSQFRVQ
jgi:hypothetical protein